MRWKLGRAVFLVAALMLLPALAAAQSQFTGQIRDESGAVLPGVTVEVSSPVMIEQMKSAISDSQGRYSVIDLRPGVYKLTYSLPGFSTIIREGVELAANFVATINIDMKVGALEESITVSGSTPLVDVQQAAKTQVLTRDLLDTLPLVRQFTNMGIVVPGIRTGAPDVGGNRLVVQNKMQARGTGTKENNITVDGLRVIGALDQGSTVPYTNDGLNEEVVITFGAGSAEHARGGVTIGSIPREGGNTVSGAVFLGGSDGDWQSNNADPTKLKNVVAPAGAGHIRNFNGSMGGPVMKNRLWWFLSVRHVDSTRIEVNSLNHLGQTAYVEDQYLRNVSPRITWQVSQKNKFAVSWDRTWKQFGHDQGDEGVDESATQTRSPAHGPYGTGAIKWTTTLTSRWLLEAGFSSSQSSYVATPQPWRIFPRGSAEWLASARKETDLLVQAAGCNLAAGCRIWNNNQENMRNGLRQALAFAASYVTGSHNIKLGVQHDFGPEVEGQNRPADLIQTYRTINGIATPYQVTIENTPRQFNAQMNYDSAIYAQDSWTHKRLTVNGGLRLEWFKSTNVDNFADPGRFVPARFFPEYEMPMDWDATPAPRLAAAYDLFGDGRTAVKANIGLYRETWSSEIMREYTAARAASSSIFNWTDTNRDDIAQEAEFLPAGCITCGSNRNFGLIANTRITDPNRKRAHNWERAVTVQHQLLNRVSVTAGTYWRTWYNIDDTDNTLISRENWLNSGGGLEFTVSNPLDRSERLRAYQLSPSVRGQAFTVDTTNRDGRSMYNGYEVSGTARLARGAVLFGGWTMEHNQTKNCSSLADNPNATQGDYYRGFTTAIGLQADADGTLWCDQTKYGIPFTHDFKLSGSTPTLLGIDVGFLMQNLAGGMRSLTHQLVNNQFPGGTTTGTAQTILLNRPGTMYLPRFFQLDFTVKKNFRFGRGRSISLQLDYFNVTNSNSILGLTNTVVNQDGGGPNLHNVTSILDGRMPRIAMQYKF
jgi:Carboxypeptidase regulatory-like domain